LNKPPAYGPLQLPALAALTALAAAAALTVFAVRYCSRTASALDADSAALVRLRQAGGALEANRAMQHAFEALPGRNLMDLAGIFGKNGFLPAPDERRQSGADLVPGWAVRSEELAFRDVQVAAALRSCEAAESLRPPWRLVRLAVRSSPNAAGRGQVVVTFEGIEPTTGK